jgi:hypothetical protein
MEPTEGSAMSRKRAIGVWALIVVASILLAGTAASLWVKRQALDTDNWVAASDDVLAEPAVQDALAAYLVDQLYANVDVEQVFAEKLPADFQGLAGPIAAGLRQPATAAVQRLLGTDQVKRVWHEVNRVAHEKLVDVLEDKGTYVSTSGGTVTLELGKLVTALGQDLGLPQGVLDRIPPDAGNIVIAQSDQLALAQTAVAAIRWMSVVLFVVVVALYAVAVWVAKGDRRRTLRNVGWAVIAVAVLLGVTRRVTGNYVTSMVDDQSLTPAVRAVYAVASRLLVQILWVVLVWGVVLVVGPVLAGPTRAAVWARRTAAPVLNVEPVPLAIGAAALYVLLLLWAPVAAFQTWGSALGLAVVLGLGLWLLRRRTLAEFPDADLATSGRAARERLGHAWSSVSGAVRNVGSGSRGAATDAGDHAGQLERLARLHDTGALSDDEFTAAKARLLT